MHINNFIVFFYIKYFLRSALCIDRPKEKSLCVSDTHTKS